jgi:peptide/nickel transport system substrate-binding protein
MQGNYWASVLQQRITRRKAIVATGMTAASAAFLAACGGSDSGTSSSSTTSTQPESKLLTKITDSSSSVKRGGAMKWTQASEPLHFDGMAQGQAQLNIYNGMVYSSLVRNKPGVGEPTTNTEVLPSLAESWEISPDKTTITFKLRQGVKFHNKAPVNGRLFDAEDVVATSKRYVGLAQNNRAANYNSINPSAPILSVTATDPRTVVYKLKEPASYIMQRIANMITGELGSIYPREADNGFDPRRDQIGTGGLMLDRHVPSVSLHYKKNPDYWDKDAVYYDTLDMPIINQAANRDAQLKTGAIYAVGGLADIAAENVLQYKKDEPKLNMYSFIAPNNNVSYIQRFGWKDNEGKKAPWLDVRVRQAMAMAIDRDTYIDAFSNVSNFNKEGLAAEPLYHTSMGYIKGVTLDPRSKDFGDTAKYYKYDLTEAKKLMAAAGFSSGFSYTNHWPNFPGFGPNFPKQMAVIEAFNQDLGIKVTSDPIDYNLKYLPDYVTKRGQHEGIVVTLGAVSSPDAVDYFVWRYYSKAGATSGAIFGDQGSGDGAGDPKVDDMIDKAKAEFDAKKQTAILGDLQKYLAEKQYAVTSPGLGTQFTLAWPAVKNYLTFQGDSRAINSFYYTWWLDENEAPLKKA